MKQTLIDKFRPEVANLSDAKRLQRALENLPDETIIGEIDTYSFPVISFSSATNLASIRYTNSPRSVLQVFFPQDAKDCQANGYICTFTYKGTKYQIN